MHTTYPEDPITKKRIRPKKRLNAARRADESLLAFARQVAGDDRNSLSAVTQQWLANKRLARRGRQK